ncbi:MAG: hypothetical protein CL527_02265 [Aequorivita sp.]|nr:hypothetical protein [Aequorivita sp.]MAO47543.1 hypothetical protein [Aequorivita sp.]MBF32232.1 hypothetical protein [Aequorivita sp.]MDX1782940.1 hypothetical protein [Aequorivita vladivostokensis]|tara:strand:+ start:79999 stop:80703 length:705 start_codon:yes stop_codon:yes gene_type:complete
MKKLIFTASLVLMTVSLFAQSGQSAYTSVYDRTIDLNQKALAFGLAEAQFNAIKYQAYTNPNFLQGKIFQDDQLIRDNVPMRYNAYADEIEIKKNISDETYSALLKSPDIFVRILNDIYVFIPLNGSNEKGGYFKILNDGKTYDLYKKDKAEFRQARKAQTSYQQDTPPSFVMQTTYYLVKDGNFLEMPNSKSRILKMMDSKKSEMKKYIKENDIDLDKEADLIKTIAYFDSLL